MGMLMNKPHKIVINTPTTLSPRFKLNLCTALFRGEKFFTTLIALKHPLVGSIILSSNFEWESYLISLQSLLLKNLAAVVISVSMGDYQERRRGRG